MARDISGSRDGSGKPLKKGRVGGWHGSLGLTGRKSSADAASEFDIAADSLSILNMRRADLTVVGLQR